MRTTEDIIISLPLFCNCFKPVVSIVLNSLLFYMCHYIHTNVIWNQIYLFNKFQQEVHIHNWDHLLLNHALSVFGITQFFTQDKRYRGALPPLMNQQASFELLKNTLKTWQSKWILLMLELKCARFLFSTRILNLLFKQSFEGMDNTEQSSI